MALTCNNENLRPHTNWYTNIRNSFIHSSRVCKEPKCPPSEGLHQRDMLGTKSASYRHTCQGSSHSTLPSARAGPPSGTWTSAYMSSVPPANTKQPPEGRRMGAEWGAENTWITKGPRELSELFGTHLPCGTQQFHSQVIYPREKKICSYKNLYTNLHSSFVCNSPKLESVWMPPTEWHTDTT